MALFAGTRVGYGAPPSWNFDTPTAPVGVKTVDEVRGFKWLDGALRLGLLGARRYSSPTTTTGFDDPSLSYDELLTKFHANPDYALRTQAVWVAQGTQLKRGAPYLRQTPGVCGRGHRVRGDHRKLRWPWRVWKVVLTNNIYDYGGQGYARRADVPRPARGAYIAERLIKRQRPPMLYDVNPMKGRPTFHPATCASWASDSHRRRNAIQGRPPARQPFHNSLAPITSSKH